MTRRRNILAAAVLSSAVLAGCGSHAAAATPVLTWGASKGGGKGDAQPRLASHDTPTGVTGIPGRVVSIATSNSDSYALTSAGTVYAWGGGRDGELGDGTTAAGSATAAVEVHFPTGVRIASLPTEDPYDGALAIDTAGNLWAWGNDKAHQMCTSASSVVDTPVELPLHDVTMAAGALTHIVALSGGTVVSCGATGNGVRGTGATDPGAGPSPVTGLPGGTVRAVEAAWGNAGVLYSDGAYYDWGYGKGGQLGDGAEATSGTPVEVHLPGPVSQVAQGGSVADNGQTLALLSDGALWAWGAGTHGQLGDGRSTDSPTPVQVDLPAGVRFTHIAAGGASGYGIDGSGRLWSWGWDASGQLGAGSGGDRDTPHDVGTHLVQVTATASNAAGLS